MSLNLRWRLALIGVVAVLCAFYVLPSVEAVRNSALGHFLPDRQVHLGLDLKGGIHLTLGVEVDKALGNSLSQAGQDLKYMAQEKEMPIIRQNLIEGKRLEFVLARPEKRADFEELLKKQFSHLQVLRSDTVDDGKVKYTVTFDQAYRKNVAEMTVEQAVKTIRNRIDPEGVKEPDIRKQAGDRIQVQLPGFADLDEAIRMVGRTAHLEFKIVDDEIDTSKLQKGVTPPGREWVTLRSTNPDGSFTDRSILVKADAMLTGEHISDARVNVDQNNQYYVGLSFTQRGARLFEKATGENVKKRMAIILDGTAFSAPVIQEKIGGGRATITGRFTPKEARELAVVLRAGALPAPISVLEQRTVGPSLGQESIDKGVMSALISGVAIAVFMVVYYGFSGIVADMALIFNLGLILAGLAAFGATLTMPGIAGIILTIGMSVDANVIVFERIREELRRGLPSRASIREGFSRATLTILDANVTTLITAVVLYEFGTGPIRGFAVTLILGLVASMFTAIFVSHSVMDLWMSGKPSEARLSI